MIGIIFEDVRASRLVRWRYADEDLWSLGSMLEQLVKSCWEVNALFTQWGTAVLATKRRKV